MSQAMQATCPGCGKTLRIPEEMRASAFQCKHCGQVLRQRVKTGPLASVPAKNGSASPGVVTPPPATNVKAVPVAAPTFAPDDPNHYLDLLRQRRRRKLIIKGVLVLVVLVGLGATGLVYKAEIGQLYDKAVAITTPKERPSVAKADSTKSESGTEGKAGSNSAETKPSGNNSSPKPAATTQAKSYPGRALLVGVRNYLYANPINPGYRPDSSLTKDPLGLNGIEELLVKGMKFDKSQVVQLSDVASQPHAPLKPTIQQTIGKFLESCRPQDRAVLTVICHVVEIEEKGYFVPLDGDLEKKEDLIPVAWLYEQLGKCPAHRKLLILDVARMDPEQGTARTSGGKLSPKLAAELEKVPEGAQVWLSCSSDENSYEFASSGFVGSVFTHFIQDFARELSDPKKRRELEKRPEFAEESLPILALSSSINEEIKKYVKERWGGTQTPKLLGKARETPEPSPEATPPPPIAIHDALGNEKLADAKLIDALVSEIGLVEVGSQSLPPFFAKNLEGYDTPADKEQDPEKHPLRAAAKLAIENLQKLDKEFTADKSIRSEPNETNFKKTIEKKQEKPAIYDQQLNDLMTDLDKAAAERDKETKRWQAHFDYIYAQMLAKRILIMEYNFVLGNKLRKDSPTLKNPQNNGWLIVPTEKLQQKDTREWEKKRQEIFERLIKEHPGTPWEVLARRDKSSFLGLTIQEAKVD